ncbi:MAG TPA: cytochrome d ubiquinol oxidase subunit II [Nocardioidaceae bacterium]|nr:cytochrome d ubiquinol oxidase subunit II [Nocardioidaceae bacterium]
MSLPELWFGFIAVLWTGFFVLEGFDFGVGMLHRVVGRSEHEQRVAINTIGPFWDANEVWLVVGGAAIFAAFPAWYATWFSAGYLAVALLLAALIIRGVSFEFRGKVENPRWRTTWSGTLTVGSLLAPLVLGVALGDLVVGLPINEKEEFTGSFWDLFTGYGVWTALTLVALCLLHGATFLTLRTTGGLRDRANRAARVLTWVALGAVAAFAVWTLALVSDSVTLYVALGAAVVAVAVAAVRVPSDRDGQAFSATAVALGATVLSLFVALYPNVLTSSTNSAWSLTVTGAASSEYALKVMTIVGAVLFPLVLGYQAWTYFVFRHRVSAGPETSEVGAGKAAD